MNTQAALAALAWYQDQGVDEALTDMPVDRFAALASSLSPAAPLLPPHKDMPTERINKPAGPPPAQQATALPLGVAQGRTEAAKMAMSAQTLEELQAAITAFDDHPLKKTATHMVFGSGHARAAIMLVGDAPGTDEDRSGQPFAGDGGRLLDQILTSIGLDRAAETPENAVYLTNILNWRPPGNRSPSPAEIELSLPFIERHIQIVRPQILILSGGVAAKALLGSGDSMSKLRRTWHEYTPRTPELQGDAPVIPAIVTYNPAYLLQTPTQKRAVWADMITLKRRYRAPA
ncbi:MAG: uracil-DNA glycosylase [Alphaproteobacteria bacterium]|nr:uracil-DNA glycosylase [Alphaproteobacteria bacterium]